MQKDSGGVLGGGEESGGGDLWGSWESVGNERGRVNGGVQGRESVNENELLPTVSGAGEGDRTDASFRRRGPYHSASNQRSGRSEDQEGRELDSRYASTKCVHRQHWWYHGGNFTIYTHHFNFQPKLILLKRL